MKKRGIVIVLALWAAVVSGQNVKIGLFANEIVKSIVVNCIEGEYFIEQGEEKIGELRKGDILFINLNEKGLDLYSQDKRFGSFENLSLESMSLNGGLRVRSVVPAMDSRIYDDDLLLESKGEFMNVINRVDIDKYIAGVLEAEIGPRAAKELYKAHAILIRTYLLKHYDRHEEEGFSLCDGVHCQVFGGRAVNNPEIAKAVYETSGEVVVDYHYKLITAVFHSNSGGETQRASDVWLEDTDYLQAVMDPHSLHQPHAKWYDTIYFADWKNYLLENDMKSVEKMPNELLYIQQRHRKKYFILDQDSILMTKIRADWGFKSTFFNMFPEVGGRIVIWGKGYGHGVGMSQEGAINMAIKGFNYKDIIKFYFFNVRIMNYEDLPRSSLPEGFE